MDKNPSVFLSYSHDNVEMSNKVLDFSNKLRNEGIDTILDQYEESPPEGWPRWMESAINDSDFILLISSEGYLGKSRKLDEKNFGKGVKWESNLIYQYIYNEGSINNIVIPVVFTENDIEFIPKPMQGVTYYNLEIKDRYDALYWRLRGIKKTEKPKLGKLRPLPTKERKSLFVTSPINIAFWDKAGWRGAAFYMHLEGIDIPYFMLPFTNEEYSKKIFEDWKELYGNEDVNDEIRISIVEGDIPGEDKGYSIQIGPNVDQVVKRMEAQGFPIDESLIMTLSRIQRAHPTDNFKMLNLFKEQYGRHHKYYLVPCFLDTNTNDVIPFFDYKLLKNKIEFRHVNEIDENDIDVAVISKNKPWKYL